MPYISNNKVAWLIPPELALLYSQGCYLPPDGWKVVEESVVAKWSKGKFGELRRGRLRARKGQQKLREVKGGAKRAKKPNKSGRIKPIGANVRKSTAKACRSDGRLL